MSTKSWLQNEWDASRQTLVDPEYKDNNTMTILPKSSPITCPACGSRQTIDSGNLVHYKCGSTYSREYSKFVVACSVAHSKQVERRGSDALDEQAARLLSGIEQAMKEIAAIDGKEYPAYITLTMALEEHKARLVAHSRPAPMDQLWQGEEDEPIMRDEE